MFNVSYNLCFEFEKANIILFILQFAKVSRNPDVIRSPPHVNAYCPYLGNGIGISMMIPLNS